MNLFYFKGNNFGDALNPFIFQELVPQLFQEESDDVFVGIGTILGMIRQEDALKKKVVFSSGFGYGPPPDINSTFEFICVRGPLTARFFNLDKRKGVCDGAILIKNIYRPKLIQDAPISFMPHWHSELKYDWRSICADLGINYISPTDEIKKTIDAIASSKYLITEAMHGAIVADTYRVPWVPVQLNKSFNTFKWNDWSNSLSLKIKPIRLKSIYDNEKYFNKSIKDKFPKFAFELGHKVAFNIYRKFIFQRNKQFVMDELGKLMLDPPVKLSNDNILNSKSEQLEELLAQYYHSKNYTYVKN